MSAVIGFVLALFVMACMPAIVALLQVIRPSVRRAGRHRR